MSAQTPATIETKTTASLSGENSFMKALGGSVSDPWNCALIRQAFGTLWVANSDEDQVKRKQDAVIGALRDFVPRTKRKP